MGQYVCKTWRAWEDARMKARELPKQRLQNPSAFAPIERTSEVIDWLPKMILGKVHQTVPRGIDGPALVYRNGEWIAVALGGNAAKERAEHLRRMAKAKPSILGKGKGQHGEPNPHSDLTYHGRGYRWRMSAAERNVAEPIKLPTIFVDESTGMMELATEVKAVEHSAIEYAPAITVESLTRNVVRPRSWSERRESIRRIRGY